jgi:putative ABC transport system permease protein
VKGALRRLGVLRHYPAILSAIVASGLVLALSAAAGALFQSSAGAEILRSGMAEHGGQALSVQTKGVLATDIVSYQERQLRLATEQISSLGAKTTAIVGPSASLDVGGSSRPRKVGLLSQTGFRSHIDVVSSTLGPEDGVWVADTIAQIQHLSPGDRVTLHKGALSIEVPVAGIYRALVGSVPSYWAPVAQAIVPSTPDAEPPPSPVLATESELLRITTALDASGTYRWTYPLTPSALHGLTYDSAQDLVAETGRIAHDANDLTTPLGLALQQPSVESPLWPLTAQAATAERSIAGPLTTLSVTGILVALIGALAAGVYGVRRRRTEVRMLNAIGMSWSRLGARFAVEAAVPLVVGAFLGWVLADRLVRTLGPSSVVDASAVDAALLASSVGIAIAIAVLGVVAAVASRVETAAPSAGRVRSALSGALWEIPILILAGAALYEITARGTAPIQGPNGSIHIDRLFLLFPILFIAGLSGLTVRAIARLVVNTRQRGRRWPVWLYLASRRLASAPRVALLLVTASCIAVGILAYAGTVVATIRSATVDKTMLAVGADTVASHGPNVALPPTGRPGRITRVISVPAEIPEQSGSINVIAVDPSTFAETAFWDGSFSADSLPDLMRLIAQGSTSSLPVIVANGSGFSPRAVTVAGYSIPVHAVASASSFPGEHRGPNLVLSSTLLRNVLEQHGVTVDSVGASFDTWAAGKTPDATRYFLSLGLTSDQIVSAADRLRAPAVRALSWALGFMEFLGAMTAIVAIIGLVLYLQARQRGRELSYALSSRMGLSSRAHRSSIAMELGSILVSALVIGSALAVGAAALVYRRLDPLPNLPPTPLLRIPVELLAIVVVCIVATTVVGSTVVQWQTRRANVAEVMRLGS